MEMNLTVIAWPASVLRCNEALNQLQPGEELVLTVRDPGVIASILMLVKSQADLCFRQLRQPESYRITVQRAGGAKDGGANLF
ncbi:MAG: hypothetical protein MUC57_12485 [Desulfobacterales bacterium]|jgi:TusA-related sulfurtransferase|nr:hypothetical protein [Desulfobacterales bacterium]